MLYADPDIVSLKEELVATIHFLHRQGWAPATSSNYSFRVPGSNIYCISQSGIDKGCFSEDNLMLVDSEGKPVDRPGMKSSAETLLHTLLYERSEINAVLHTHTVNNTVLSMAHAVERHIVLQGYEVLKGLQGISTHEASVTIPIFPNAQDMPTLAADIKAYWLAHPDMPAFLLAGHGLYAWGSTIAEAKRHIEVLEFLFDCTIKRKIYGGS